MEELLGTEIGKHDYDWLLTPPGTPRAPALEVAEKAPPSNVPKRTVTRSSSTTRASRDIRHNLGGIRGASLFPHSIRSSAAKGPSARMSDPGHHTSNGEHDAYTDSGSINGHFSSDSIGALSHYGGSSTDSPDRESMGTKETLSELDMYGSSRYEEMLLREDTKNTDWLHSVDDKSDQSPVFDHGFEPLPEPFGPL